MSEIVVLIPVLNRPQNARPVAESIRATSDAQIAFLVSDGDMAEWVACCEVGRDVRCTDVWRCQWEPGPGDYARKINWGFAQYEHPFVFLGADDLEFTPGWTEATKLPAGVIGTNDDANPLVKRGRHSTHSIVRRSYISEAGGTWFDGPGVVYHEGYDHQCVDNELVQAAIDRKEWAFSHRAIVRHLHPMYPGRSGRVLLDDTYRKGLAKGSEDRALFIARQAKARPRR